MAQSYQRKATPPIAQGRQGGTAAPVNRQGGTGGSAQGSTKPTHYAYRLVVDQAGNTVKNNDGVNEKEFIQGLYVYENQSQFGDGQTYIKMNVTEDILAGGPIFIVKNKT